MTDKQPDALRVADELEAPIGTMTRYAAAQQGANLLRTQHAAIERKDALLKQALHVINHCIPRNEDNADELAEAIKQELAK